MRGAGERPWAPYEIADSHGHRFEEGNKARSSPIVGETGVGGLQACGRFTNSIIYLCKPIRERHVTVFIWPVVVNAFPVRNLLHY